MVKKEIHIIIEVPDTTGKGGTSTTGNSVSTILGDDKNRKLLSSLVPEQYREAMDDVLLRLWLIMKIYNSNDEVNEYFDEFSKETCIMLLTSFNKDQKNWIYLSPTVHGLLHHSWEVIQANGNFGLQEYSESALEGNMKFIRFYREFLARKLDQFSNLTDCFSRMWLKSDPDIRKSITLRKQSITHNSTLIRPFTKEQHYLSLLLK